MRRLVILLGAALFLTLPLQIIAQNHGEVGAYADYFRFSPTNSSANFVGVGGRLSLNVRANLAFEGEMNYDFARNFTTTHQSTNSGGVTTTFTKTSVRPLTGLFGPKLQLGTTGPFRAFVTGKMGFINFSTSNRSSNPTSTFAGSVTGVGGGGTHLAFYPGAGVEAFLGPVGFRLDVGDEIYLNNGTYNNLRVTFGPHIRF